MTSDRVVLPRLVLAEAANFPKLAEFWRREIVDHGIALMSGIVSAASSAANSAQSNCSTRRGYAWRPSWSSFCGAPPSPSSTRRLTIIRA